MSRVHPGESTAYNAKVCRREEREYERELLARAKAMYREIYG